MDNPSLADGSNNVEKSTYLRRAKALIKMNSVRAGVLAVVPLSAMIAAKADAQGPLRITNAIDNYISGSGPQSRPANTTFNYSETAKGVKFSGGFTENGANWQSMGNNSGFRFRLDSNVAATIKKGSTLDLSWNFTINFTGGTVGVFLSNFLDPNYPNSSAEDRSNSINLNPASGVQQIGSLSSNPFALDHTTGYSQLVMEIYWTGQSSSDTLTVTIPNNSIDTAVPEPSTTILFVAAAGFILLFRYRRLRLG